MTSLKNKIAIITGSSKGLGKAIAENYARPGANIVSTIIAINRQQMKL